MERDAVYVAEIAVDGELAELLCACASCEWKGTGAELEAVESAELTAGDPSPIGRCPSCYALAYLRPAGEAKYNGKTFDAVELDTVISVLDFMNQQYCEPVHSVDEYKRLVGDAGEGKIDIMYSVYGHLAVGGVECFADCATIGDARLIGEALAKHWSVPINDLMVEIEDK